MLVVWKVSEMTDISFNVVLYSCEEGRQGVLQPNWCFSIYSFRNYYMCKLHYSLQ